MRKMRLLLHRICSNILRAVNAVSSARKSFYDPTLQGMTEMEMELEGYRVFLERYVLFPGT